MWRRAGGSMRWTYACSAKCCIPVRTTARYLSVEQTATALRPFYFAVHPDLFGMFPTARDVNETSLKQLRQYLDDRQTDALRDSARAHRKSLELVFYVRHTTQRQDVATPGQPPPTPLRFSTVQITLSDLTVREAVTSILKSCNLPTDYVESIPVVDTQHRGLRKLQDKLYDYYGIPNPEQLPKKPIQTLSSWLRRSIEKAHKAQQVQDSIGEDIARLTAELRREAGVTGVRWTSSWGLPQYRASLTALLTLCRQHASQINLHGYGVMFGGMSGVSTCNHVMLRNDDVSDQWLKVLRSVPEFAPIVRKLPAHENMLSHLLNHAHICRADSPILLANQYLHELRHVNHSLERYLAESTSDRLLHSDMRDIDVILMGSSERRGLNGRGQMMLPSACQPSYLVDFLNDNVPRARVLMNNHRQRQEVTDQLVAQCTEELGVASLEWEPSITHQQLVLCLKRLCDVRNVGVSLQGCHLLITLYYSVMASGKICIPWNWKGYDDEI